MALSQFSDHTRTQDYMVLTKANEKREITWL